MIKDKSLTPVITHKYQTNKNKDDYELDLRTNGQLKPKATNLNFSLMTSEKIKSNPSFSLDKISTRTIEIAKTNLLPDIKKKDSIRLPMIKNRSNPEDGEDAKIEKVQKLQKMKSSVDGGKIYYQSSLQRCLKKHETSYMMNLYRQHFYQCIEVLRFGKSIKVTHPRKTIHLSKKNPEFKTIYLDMDQTLIHTDERSNSYTVKLNFPLERGGVLAAGIRVRPYCQEFLKELAEFAEIIIFTASSASYADVVLDYLDPQKKYISHRLYRQHCTLEKGFYLKDLRVANRNLEDVVLVDNSPYCHILQPENGIPIVPFYHYSKDRELESLLPFLRQIVEGKDLRAAVKETFFWEKYTNENGDPRKLFFKYYNKQ